MLDLKKCIYDLLGEIYETTMLFGILNTLIDNVTRYSFDIFFKNTYRLHLPVYEERFPSNWDIFCNNLTCAHRVKPQIKFF